jgi:hypothetical protein
MGHKQAYKCKCCTLDEKLKESHNTGNPDADKIILKQILKVE